MASIPSLMSPPEATPLEDPNTTPSKPAPMTPINDNNQIKSISLKRTPLSPPISPCMKENNASGEEVVQKGEGFQKDLVLYHDSAPFSQDAQPLFPAEGAKAGKEPILNSCNEHIQRAIDQHLYKVKDRLNKPTPDEYKLSCTFVSQLNQQFAQNPREYKKRRIEESNDYQQSKRLCATTTTPKQKPGQKTLQVESVALPPPGKRAIKPLPKKSTAAIRTKRPSKPSATAKLMNFPVKGRSSEAPDRPPTAKRDDTDYAALPDYAPPLSTLPDNPKVLKADWPSNNVLDLSNDPDRGMLHEAEVNLAATLRLTCATYLCSKRRIFEARLNALRIGKEFRKTDAQQACKIDVNKASKLWTAYDKVGWFNPDYFRKFLTT